MEYEPIIGMEVHVQLVTRSKMFCGCSADYAGAEPNTHTCPVCVGFPGVLPVINRQAVEFTIMTGLALNCEIPAFTKWDRKNYPYPDLPKGYQISQYDLPLTQNGWLEIEVDGQTRRIGITRAHLEEDTGKLTHVGGASLVDYNRSGVPLMEVVTEPDMHSADEAHAYLVKLRQILRYLGASTGDMEKGAMRCEPNVSLRPAGSAEFGTKVEVKNLNSFKSVRLALEYEVQRQARILDEGGRVEQVTVGWDENQGVTVVQRSKEYAHDYRYFPEPDLPPLVVSREWVDEIRARLPELPDARRDRFVSQYGLSRYDANVLVADRPVADYYETAVDAAGEAAAKTVANWVTGELFRLMKATETDVEAVRVGPQAMGELLALVDDGTLSISAAKTVLGDMFETGQSAAHIVDEKGLRQISDAGELGRVIDEVITANPRPVEEYLGGKKQALSFLVGQVMKATRGKANPRLVNELLEQTLDATK